MNVRILTESYCGVVRDYLDRTLPLVPIEGALNMGGVERAYWARGPPGGPITEFHDNTGKSDAVSVHSATDPSGLFRGYDGPVLVAHTHGEGRPIPSAPDIRNLRRLSERAGRTVPELILGRIGFLATAAYTAMCPPTNEDALSHEDWRQHADEYYRMFITGMAGLPAEPEWLPRADWPEDLPARREAAIDLSTRVYVAARKPLARAFVPAGRGGPLWRYLPIELVD